VARRVERHFGSHQDIEWAIARGQGDVYIVQSRPVTAMAKKAEQSQPASAIDLVMSKFGANRAD